jgi:hypothetical protein
MFDVLSEAEADGMSVQVRGERLKGLKLIDKSGPSFRLGVPFLRDLTTNSPWRNGIEHWQNYFFIKNWEMVDSMCCPRQMLRA